MTTLIRVLRTRTRWVLLGLIGVPAILVFLTLREEPRYTATAALLFRDSAAALLEEVSGGSREDPMREAATNDALINLPTVSLLAAKRFNARPRLLEVSPQSVAESVTVSPSAESDLIEVKVEGSNPRVAAELANDYGDSYIQFRRESDREQLAGAIGLVERRLAAMSPEQRSGPAGQGLEARLDDLRLQQALQTGKAELVQRAIPPEEPSSPDLRRNLVLGLLLGGIVGLGAGLVRDRLDQSLRTVEEVEELYGLPVLARVPRSRDLGGKKAAAVERSAEAEAFRSLRANLRFFDVDDDLRSLLMASPMSGDGKSTVAFGLARTMAAMGDAVVLVDADLHKGSTLPGGDLSAGLSAVLTGTALDEALVEIPLEEPHEGNGGRSLTVLPSGPTPPNPLELLESDTMARVLDTLEDRFDYVIVDSPALTDVTDARPLVSEVSGVLIVIALNHTTRMAATDSWKELQLLEGNALGLLVNMVPTQRSGYYHR